MNSLIDKLHKNVVVINVDPWGCGWYRIRQPLYELVKENKINLHFMTAEEYGKDNVRFNFPTVIFQRFIWQEHFSDEFKQIRKTFADNGIELKVYCDIDDDFYRIPEWSPAKDKVKKIKLAMLETLGEVDEVTVSTPNLVSVYERVNEKIHVVPNFVKDIEHSNVDCLRQDNKHVKLLWGGSATHWMDVEEPWPHIEKFLNSRDDVSLAIIGYIHPKVQAWGIKNPDRFEFYQFVNSKMYLTNLEAINPDIGLCLLTEHEFNNSKSNIKYLEYSAMGIPTVASNVGPYKCITQGKDGYRVKKLKDWGKYLTKLVDNPKLRYRIGQEAKRKWNNEKRMKKSVRIWEELILGRFNHAPSATPIPQALSTKSETK